MVDRTEDVSSVVCRISFTCRALCGSRLAARGVYRQAAPCATFAVFGVAVFVHLLCKMVETKVPSKVSKKPAAATTVAKARKKRIRKRKSVLYKAPGRAEKRMPKLRSSIKPGTVLILLAGGHRGKRVIFLKQLSPSGLLLVTGPFKINGVPLRRVNHRYVIATSTRVDVSGVGNLDSITDKRFGQTKKSKIAERKLRLKQDESMFVQQSDAKTKQALPDEAKKLQDTVDKSILSALDKDKLLAQYLKTRFTLRSGMLPHAMKF